jgi:hypothetical protein
MNKFLSLIFLLACLVPFDTRSQNGNYIAVAKADEIPWERYESPTKRFIIAGEAHHVSCIFPFQLSHLKYLAAKGFRHLVWEVPHSYAFIAQQYISSGNDSLLQFLTGSTEAWDYWKGVRAINQALPQDDKLHVWGIDHELGDNVGGQYRSTIYKKALQLLAESRGEMPPSLRQEYLALEAAVTVKAVTDIKHRLQKLVHHPEVAAFFGEQLPHFIVLANRLDHFKVRRNDEMLEAFKEICSLFRLDSSAKFLGRFGWGHIDKSQKNSMSWLLENDPSSPVRNSTFVIGVQYLECASAARNNGFLENDGIVHDGTQKKALAALNRQDPSPIKIFTWPEGEKRKGWAKEADVLFVFSGFPAVTLLKK